MLAQLSSVVTRLFACSLALSDSSVTSILFVVGPAAAAAANFLFKTNLEDSVGFLFFLNLLKKYFCANTKNKLTVLEFIFFLFEARTYIDF